MIMLRIINKQTGMFLRDDFTFDEETEIGLEANPAQGFYLPKWDGKEWIEGLTDAEILAIRNQAITIEPTLEERVAKTETKVVSMEEIINTIFL